jgi:hypothetical protein
MVITSRSFFDREIQYTNIVEILIPPRGIPITTDIYFITRNGLDKSSDRIHLTYDEAKEYLLKDREDCERKGTKSDLSILTQVNVDQHYRSIRKLIEDYHESNRQMEDPMVVLFSQSKQYAIMPNEELTPALWIVRPYVVYGAVEDYDASE